MLTFCCPVSTNKVCVQGQVTSEQQFSFVPRQPQQQPPAQPQFPDFSPSARPAVGAGPDNVPTVPAVTSLQRFRPSEASALPDTDTDSFRFQPSPRPQPRPPPKPQQVPVFQEEAGFPGRLPVRPQQFPNSHTSARTPTFTVPPAISIEPISGSGVINRSPNLVAAESETTGSAFRGRQRVRVRPDQIDTGKRAKVRSKIRFSEAAPAPAEAGAQAEDSVEAAAPAVTAGRGRTRSRFTGTRSRAPTAPRVVVTGTRKRQRFRDSPGEAAQLEEDIPEEPRRSELGTLRRKVNRIPSFTSRRKTTPPAEAPVTRVPPRRRLKPFPVEDDQEIVGFETESPEILLEEEVVADPGISVQPVSTVRYSAVLSL